MDPLRWELVGTLTKTEGNEGELLLKVENDFPEEHQLEDPVFIPVERKDEGLPFYLTQRIRISKKQYAVRFELVDDEKRASHLKGLGVWLPREDPPEQGEESELLEKVMGYRVIDQQQGELGKVEDGIERSEQPLALVGPDRIPIPLSDALIERIDEEAKTLYTDLPEGLTDLSV